MGDGRHELLPTMNIVKFTMNTIVRARGQLLLRHNSRDFAFDVLPVVMQSTTGGDEASYGIRSQTAWSS